MQKEMFSHRSDRTNTFQVQLYVQLRTVPNAIITDDTQPRTPNQSSMARPARISSWRVPRVNLWPGNASVLLWCCQLRMPRHRRHVDGEQKTRQPEMRAMTIFWIYLNLTLTSNLSETWTATNWISVYRTCTGVNCWRCRWNSCYSFLFSLCSLSDY